MKCYVCGKEFHFGNRPDGLPNGIGFETLDGIMINICSECVMDENTSAILSAKLEGDGEIHVK